MNSLGSIGEIMIVLFIDDPKFDQKCMARGLDREEVQGSMKVTGHSLKIVAGDKQSLSIGNCRRPNLFFM
jgi:hypothetical protein